MNVDLSAGCPVDRAKTVCEVLRGSVRIVVVALVLWEVGGDGGDGKLLVEKVDLVQEQNNGFVLEPFSVDKGFEKHHGLVHLVLVRGQRSARQQASTEYDIPRSGLPLDTGHTQKEPP